VPESYKNVANHIRIPGLAKQAGLTPGSPTDIQLSVPMINLTIHGADDPMSPVTGGGRAVPEMAAVSLPAAALDEAEKVSME
jgi:hypothetical protein